MNETSSEAWVEDAAGRRVSVEGVLTIGRASSNTLVLPHDKVSRRHAVIQLQGSGEYWVVDFGSRNGTYRNGRRLSHPERLQSGDELAVGPFRFVFSCPGERRMTDPMSTAVTVAEIVPVVYWLLVTDIIDSTRLAKELAPEELPQVTGEWLGACKRVIDNNGGSINQFMGDGFFAFWRDREAMEVRVAKALRELGQLQDNGRPSFRFALHLGRVTAGGVALGEEHRIAGTEVHRVFRMEKLAGRLGRARLLSEEAWKRLAGLVAAEEVGLHALPGFDQPARFFSM